MTTIRKKEEGIIEIKNTKEYYEVLHASQDEIDTSTYIYLSITLDYQFVETGSPYSPQLTWNLLVQACLDLTRDLPASVSTVMGLKACGTTPNRRWTFLERRKPQKNGRHTGLFWHEKADHKNKLPYHQWTRQSFLERVGLSFLHSCV